MKTLPGAYPIETKTDAARLTTQVLERVIMIASGEIRGLDWSLMHDADMQAAYHDILVDIAHSILTHCVQYRELCGLPGTPDTTRIDRIIKLATES